MAGDPPQPSETAGMDAADMDTADTDTAALLTAVPFAVCVTRGPGHVVEMLNLAAWRLLGHDDVVGRPVREVIPERLAAGRLELLDRVYAGGQPHHDPEHRVLLRDGATLRERFFAVSCLPRRTGDGTIGGLVLTGYEITGTVRAARHAAFLAGIGPVLLESSLDETDTLHRAAELAVPRLGELCVIRLVTPDGSLHRAAVAHSEPGYAELADALLALPPSPGSPVHRALATGRPEIVSVPADERGRALVPDERTADLLGAAGITATLVVPLVAHGRTLGVLSASSASPGLYSDDDVALAEGLALRVGLALDAAALYASQRDARRRADLAGTHTWALQTVAAALGRATNPAEIGRAVVDEGVGLLGAAWGSLYALADDELELVHACGWAPDIVAAYRRQRMRPGLPSADAVLAREPLWLESVAAWSQRYPGLAERHGETGPEALAVLPLLVGDRVFGSVDFGFPRPRRFDTDERAFLLALANHCAQALDRVRSLAAEREARAAAERQRDRVGFLAEASLVLERPLSQEQRLARLARLAVPRIADWCAVHLLHGDRVENIAVAHADPDKATFVDELTRRYPPKPEDDGALRVARTGVAELYRDVPDELLVEAAVDETHLALIRSLMMRSAMVVPLRVRGRSVGALTLVAAESGQRFDDGDLAFAQDLAARAALALDNARLYEEQREIAATLQGALLPRELPSIPGVELAGRYQVPGSSGEVGGDLYDVFATGDGWSLLVADVCGKGAVAATLTALIRYTVRAEASHGLAPVEVLRRLNSAVLCQRESVQTRFCTVLYGRLTSAGPGSGVDVTLTCAGHPPPRVLRRDGSVVAVRIAGTVLGVYPDPVLTQAAVRLAPGEALVLYTDGVTEARGSGGFYGEQRLDALLTGCGSGSAEHIAGSVADEVLRVQQGSLHDDVAVLVVRALPLVDAEAGA